MSGQKFNLYSKALCVSGREQIAAINGLEVSIIGYRNAGDLGYVYSVSHEAKAGEPVVARSRLPPLVEAAP